ncbi:hypothetical protein BT69DRAFT_1287774 [Atractiella rhizophila]|nr:hypothetical protein BT69DRAFT_1287774 [Atractiella rhizophila]
MYIQLTAMILTCIRRDCGENLTSLDDVADAEMFEWRWRLTRKRIDVLDAKRREYCCGGVSYALGNTAYKVVRIREERGLEGIKSEKMSISKMSHFIHRSPGSREAWRETPL